MTYLIILFVLGLIYAVVYWLVSRLPLWALVPVLGVSIAPYLIDWDGLMAPGIHFNALPYIILLTGVGALTAALMFQVLMLRRATADQDARVALRFLVGLIGFPVSAVAVLSI